MVLDMKHVGLICRCLVGVFTFAYIAALVIYIAGELGLLGQRDPLGGALLSPLGLPWNQFTERAPEVLRPWLALTAPVLNMFVLVGLCHITGKRPRQRDKH
jgi:hypothetical protein